MGRLLGGSSRDGNKCGAWGEEVWGEEVWGWPGGGTRPWSLPGWGLVLADSLETPGCLEPWDWLTAP